MPTEKREYQRVKEFDEIARKLVDKYPERFYNIDPDQIVCYAVVNKPKPREKAKIYEMRGITDELVFHCDKTFFVRVYQEDWDARPDNVREAVVCSVLLRIDPDSPGKVGPLDYRDQTVMINTFGPNWEENGDIPSLLDSQVVFRGLGEVK